jgi:hypothetical protein
MNREQIIRMAQEAISLKMEDHVWTMSTTHLERFAGLVRADERNACAKVVEDYCGAWDDKGYTLAAAIRARSKQCG